MIRSADQDCSVGDCVQTGNTVMAAVPLLANRKQLLKKTLP